METLEKWDEQLFLWLNNLGSAPWDGFWIFLSEKTVWIPLYALLIFLIFKTLKTKTALWVLLGVAVLILFTDSGSTFFFKERFDRLRPCHTDLISKMRLVAKGCGGQFGFLSAHAANTFGLAVLVGKILQKKFRWILPLLLFWAVLVAYSRIYLGVHYPLDVAAGALYGTLCALLIFKMLQPKIKDNYR